MNGQPILTGGAFISQVSIVSVPGISSHTQIMAQERSKVNYFTTLFSAKHGLAWKNRIEAETEMW
jgi:hypothetical protein